MFGCACAAVLPASYLSGFNPCHAPIRSPSCLGADPRSIPSRRNHGGLIISLSPVHRACPARTAFATKAGINPRPVGQDCTSASTHRQGRSLRTLGAVDLVDTATGTQRLGERTIATSDISWQEELAGKSQRSCVSDGGRQRHCQTLYNNVMFTNYLRVFTTSAEAETGCTSNDFSGGNCERPDLCLAYTFWLTVCALSAEQEPEVIAACEGADQGGSRLQQSRRSDATLGWIKWVMIWTLQAQK